MTQDKEPAKRSEILFCYDARMCNPNGDPDVNMPRKDDLTGKLHVTEFRLKRTIRKYMNEVMGLTILLRQEPDESEVGGFKRLEKLPGPCYFEEVKDKDGVSLKKKKKGAKDKDEDGPLLKVDRRKLLQDHIDIRLFGILFAVPSINFKQEGPVQFGIGQSLNDNIEVIRIGMTSMVPNTKDVTGKSEGGSFGEKYLVRYAFVQFHGFINNNVAKQKDLDLTEEDVMTMLTAMWKGTDNLDTSSKFGQKSRLLIKVNYKDNGYIGDLDLMPKLEREAEEKGGPLENITQVKLNLDNLLELIESNNDIIESIEYEYNPMLVCKHHDNTAEFEKIITEWSKGSEIPVARLKLN